MALTLKQRKFVDAYLGEANGNATKAAQIAGYAHPGQQGHETLKILQIREELERIYRENCMGPEEALKLLADQARGAGAYIETDGSDYRPLVNVGKMLREGKGHLIHSVKYTDKGQPVVEFYDAQSALREIGRHHKLFTDRTETDINLNLDNARETLDGKLAQLAARAGQAGLPPKSN